MTLVVLSIITTVLQGITGTWIYIQSNEIRKKEHYVVAALLVCGVLASGTSSVLLYIQSQRPQIDLERAYFYAVSGGTEVRVDVKNTGQATAHGFHGAVVLDALQPNEDPAAVTYSESQATSVMELAPQGGHPLFSEAADPAILKQHIQAGDRIYAKGSLWYAGFFRNKVQYPFCYLLNGYGDFEIRDGRTCGTYKGRS